MVPTYLAWHIYNIFGVARLGSAPVFGNKALPDTKKKYHKSLGALSPKVSLKTSFPWVPTRRIEYPQLALYNTYGPAPLDFNTILRYTVVIHYNNMCNIA